MEEKEGENLAPTTDDQDDSGDIWKLSISNLELEPEPDPDKLGIGEEAVERVMKWLESEIASTSPSSSSSFLQVTEFVTINGNEETCGSSFSSTASTVMASIDTRYEAPYLGSKWPFAGGEVAPTGEVGGGGETTEGGADYEWMDFVLADDFAEMEQCSLDASVVGSNGSVSGERKVLDGD